MIGTFGIVGQGFVGNAIKKGFTEFYPNILTYDKNPDLSLCSSLSELVNGTEIIFVCVPTPMRKDGSCYTGIVEEVVSDISEIAKKENTTKIVILKTTIPPGTTDEFQNKYKNLQLVFNPEFLTEKNAVNDFKNQNRIVLGSDSKEALDVVTDLYQNVYNTIPIVKMSSKEAEMVKYVTNTFLSTKVIFANEMYQICNGLNINYDNVIKAAKLDTRLGESHWQVPGHDGDMGFGGHCFPKDTNALIYSAKEKDVDTTLLSAVIEKNNKIRKNRDWENQEGRSIINK